MPGCGYQLYSYILHLFISFSGLSILERTSLIKYLTLFYGIYIECDRSGGWKMEDRWRIALSASSIKGKALNRLPLTETYCWLFVNTPYHTKKVPFFSRSAGSFVFKSWMGIEFYQMLFLQLLRCLFLFLNLLMWWITLNDFLMLNQFWDPWVYPIWLSCVFSLYILLD